MGLGVLEERESFWYKVLRARYVEVAHFGGGRSSVWWKNLKNVREGASMLEVG